MTLHDELPIPGIRLPVCNIPSKGGTIPKCRNPVDERGPTYDGLKVLADPIRLMRR